MVEVHEIVALPEPMIVLGVMLPQASPDGTVSARLTVPPNWLIELIVTVVIAKLPAFTGPGELADMVNSRYWNRPTALWAKDPLVPVRVSV
jgi:hypothetical protein